MLTIVHLPGPRPASQPRHDTWNTQQDEALTRAIDAQRCSSTAQASRSNSSAPFVPADWSAVASAVGIAAVECCNRWTELSYHRMAAAAANSAASAALGRSSVSSPYLRRSILNSSTSPPLPAPTATTAATAQSSHRLSAVGSLLLQSSDDESTVPAPAQSAPPLAVSSTQQHLLAPQSSYGSHSLGSSAALLSASLELPPLEQITQSLSSSQITAQQPHLSPSGSQLLLDDQLPLLSSVLSPEHSAPPPSLPLDRVRSTSSSLRRDSSLPYDSEDSDNEFGGGSTGGGGGGSHSGAQAEARPHRSSSSALADLVTSQLLQETAGLTAPTPVPTPGINSANQQGGGWSTRQ